MPTMERVSEVHVALRVTMPPNRMGSAREFHGLDLVHIDAL
jgi:hypothetical protein